jgi:IclR family KDG regulon transcriptional repressor
VGTIVSIPRKTRVTEPPGGREAAEADEGTLDSVTVVAQILHELAVAQQPMGVTQLARQLDHSKARIYRYLASLKQLGLVEQDAATERYRLGWKLFQLGEAAAQQFDLRRLADPYLKRLRDLTGVTALLAVPVNGEAMVIATAEADRNVSITVKPGNRPSPHSSAQGRIVLAFLAEPALTRVLKRKATAYTPHSLTEPGAIRERLARIRERLYEDAPNEILIGINALSAPILRDADELVGLIGIVGSIQDIPSPARPEQIEWVRGCGAALSEALHARLYAERGIAVPRDSKSLSA